MSSVKFDKNKCSKKQQRFILFIFLLIIYFVIDAHDKLRFILFQLLIIFLSSYLI